MSKTSTDPIADMLTRIRNAIAVNKQQIILPHSKVKEAIAQILVQNRFIENFEVGNLDKFKVLTLNINSASSTPKITAIKRISRPGRRSYVVNSKIPTIKQGRGMVIVSTSKGLMSGLEAKRLGIGGELICQVY